MLLTMPPVFELLSPLAFLFLLLFSSVDGFLRSTAPFASSFLPLDSRRNAVNSNLNLNSFRSEEKKDPLLLRAARGEKTERVPVWM